MAPLTAVQASLTFPPVAKLVAVRPVGVEGGVNPVGTIGAKSDKWETVPVNVLAAVSTVVDRVS